MYFDGPKYLFPKMGFSMVPRDISDLRTPRDFSSYGCDVALFLFVPISQHIGPFIKDINEKGAVWGNFKKMFSHKIYLVK